MRSIGTNSKETPFSNRAKSARWVQVEMCAPYSFKTIANRFSVDSEEERSMEDVKHGVGRDTQPYIHALTRHTFLGGRFQRGEVSWGDPYLLHGSTWQGIKELGYCNRSSGFVDALFASEARVTRSDASREEPLFERTLTIDDIPRKKTLL
jgi:hypothetical protein